MQYLEQFLSPFVAGHSQKIIHDLKPLDENDKLLMQQFREQKISVFKKRVVPQEADLVRPEIMDSWMRCFENGLDPFQYNYPPIMSQRAFQVRLDEKRFFLDAAAPYMSQFEKMLHDLGSYMFLSDEEGVILRTAKTLGKNKFWLTPGAAWSEETTGTCSHVMCLLQKTPIQVCGPEHFSQIFKQIHCSSAPVLNTSGELEGTLTISSSYLHSQSSQSLGLVATIASAIQKEFQLAEKKDLLSAALSAAGDSLVVIIRSGRILMANTLAKQVFRHDLEGMNYESILGNQPLIRSVCENGKGIDNSDIVIDIGSKKLHLVAIRPISDPCFHQDGCILTLKEVSKKITLRGSRYSTAKFSFKKIVGSSSQTEETIRLAKKFSAVDQNILLQGESGTGKEVYAQSIHEESRPDGDFVAVNCAAIPGTLIESELFGYEPGAFTGAERKGKMGKIEMANMGTLFLDEIGDMPLELQSVLLRVLEDKQVMRIGGQRYLPVDFRLVAATNRDLLALVEEGRFREDLYYRLCVFKLEIDPLRSRGSDIIELAEHFMTRHAQSKQQDRPVLSSPAKYVLLQYPWPGNVRQLQNAITYAVCMCEGDAILPEHLPKEVTQEFFNPSQNKLPRENQTHPPDQDNGCSMKDIEKMVIKKALSGTNNHIRAAAKVLGISKSTIYRKIKEYDLDV